MVSPNPLGNKSSIVFSLPHADDVRVEIWNMQGQLQSVVFDGNLQEGSYTIRWDRNQAAAGVYICKLQTSEGVDLKNVVKAE